MSLSQSFNALKTNNSLFFESNSSSVTDLTNHGFFLHPSKGVPGRPDDITGYVLKAVNEQGKVEWSEETGGKTVFGAGSVWFSSISGEPLGDNTKLYWDNDTKRLGLSLNGINPEFTIDTIGGIQSDILYVKSLQNQKNIGIKAPLFLTNSYIITLPFNTGSTGQVLSTNGTGNLYWANGTGNLVPGEGAIWFSDINGSPVGDDTKLRWFNDELLVNGIVKALNFKTFSDARLKTNVVPLDDSLERVCKIEGVKYNLLDKSAITYGVIAQQLEEIGLTHLVDSTGEYKSVDYIQMIPLLVESIKALTNKIELMEKKIQSSN